MQKKSPRRTRMIGGCDASSFSFHHGATENGSTLRNGNRNATGPRWPPVCVTKARTTALATSHDGWLCTLRSRAAFLPPLPVLRERVGARVLLRLRVFFKL